MSAQSNDEKKPRVTLRGTQQRSQRRRLRVSLVAFFVLLALPFFAVIFLVKSKLEQESFYIFKEQADQLSKSISEQIAKVIAAEELRQFGDYQFLSVGDSLLAQEKQVARSPLSSLSPTNAPPGIIGYFQLDGENRFSSPLLPQDNNVNKADLLAVGVTAQEVEQRAGLTKKLRDILSRNSLVPQAELALANASPLAKDKADKAGDQSQAVVEYKKSQEALEESPSSSSPYGDYFSSNVKALKAKQEVFSNDSENRNLNVNRKFWQQQEADIAGAAADAAKGSVAAEASAYSRGGSKAPQVMRMKRIEKILLPEKQALNEVIAQQASGVGRQQRAEGEGVAIAVFEGEIDPMQCVLLEDNQLLCYRKVWQGGKRYIQGFVLNSAVFLQNLAAEQFYNDVLAEVGTLVVSYRKQVIGRYQEVQPSYGYSLISSRGSQSSVEQEQILLQESTLPAPLDDIQLAFLVGNLGPGPGADVLGVAALGFLAVLLLGLWVIYRQSLAQIELAEQRSNFVSAVSHELKTPLTSIRMYAEMLREGWVSDQEKVRSYYDFIFFESERLSRLISNVLQLAKIGRGAVKPELSLVAVGTLLDLIESKISSQTTATGFSLQLVRSAESEKVLADSDLFTQIFINLADNAVKFSAKSADKNLFLGVRLEGEASRQRASFFLRDFGPGIASGQMKKIFQLFYRAEDELTRAAPGTGIGLALVHQLATQMNATVDVRNREPGAEFIVSFPIARY